MKKTSTKELIKDCFKAVRLSFMIILFVGISSATFASSAFKVQTRNFNIKNVSLKEAIEYITKNSKLNLTYSLSDIDSYRNISIDVKNVTSEDALKIVLNENGLSYTIKGNNLVISKPAPVQQSNEKLTIKGKVLGTNKKPIAGVTILVVGSTTGAITDEAGNYSLTLNKGQEIEVSYVGMETLKRKIEASNANLMITLTESAIAVDDVIVTGYQEIKKERMTGSTETITSKDIANRGYTSVGDALKGQMAGVSTMNISGRPGASAEIRIRGINSITGSSDPIWIVDGMPLQGDVPSISMGGTEFQETVLTNGIGNIPPDDIESITVLKDAAATAIYGARAANGVIVIKTKRGAVGRSSININSSYAISEAPRAKFQLMNTEQKIAYERGVYEDFPSIYLPGRVHTLLRRAANDEITSAQAESEIARLSTIDTDWYKEIFRVAQTQNHSVTLSGGSETTQYYGNVSYLGQEGVMPNNFYETLGANLKLTHDFNKRLRINLDLRSSIRNDRSSAANVNPLNYATFANPYERLYDDNGNYEYDRSFDSQKSSVRDGYKNDFNFMREMNENTTKSKYISNQVAIKLEYNILTGLMFSSLGTYSNSNTTSMSEVRPGTYTSATGSWIKGLYNQEVPSDLNNGKMSESNSRSSSWTIRNQLEFARSFGDETHHVSAFMGQEVSSSAMYGFRSMIPEWDPVYGMATYPDINGAIVNSNISLSSFGSHSEGQDRSVSFFVTGSYSYKDRYIASASARLDGADIIGTANRFNPLWNVSFKWNLHNEKFMQGVTFINQLAIRGSYGYTGSIDRNVLPFSTMELSSSRYTYDGMRILDRYFPANPSVKWQRKEDKNIGFDASVLNNRINFSANYYNNDTRDIIGTNSVAMSSGLRKISANVASIRNSGYELSLKTVNVRTKDFAWSTSVNFSFNKNIVTDTYYKKLEDYPASALMTESFIDNTYIQGRGVNSFYGYQWAGIDPSDGTTLVYIDGFREDGTRLGSPYKDGRYVFNLDNDKKNAENVLPSRVYLGESNPPYTGGFSTQLNYKRLSFSANFSFYFGHIIKSYQTLFNSQFTANMAGPNAVVDEANRWRKPGDNTNIARYSATEYSARAYYVFDSNFEKGDYLKCNNISIGYNFGNELCSKLRLSRARVNFNMQNPFTLTNYRGADPENRGAFGYPVSKIYNISISIGI